MLNKRIQIISNICKDRMISLTESEKHYMNIGSYEMYEILTEKFNDKVAIELMEYLLRKTEGDYLSESVFDSFKPLKEQQKEKIKPKEPTQTQDSTQLNESVQTLGEITKSFEKSKKVINDLLKM